MGGGLAVPIEKLTLTRTVETVNVLISLFLDPNAVELVSRKIMYRW